MPLPDDESKTGTLPDPELNPLLNPLLAANMGRWAEVYFTNPPEKRAQAVADLLRELETNTQSERHADRKEFAPEEMEKKTQDVLLRASFEPMASTAVCAACGHSNGAGQRFCGMCGMPLPVSEVDWTRRSEPELIQESWHERGNTGREVLGEEKESSFEERSPVSYSSGDLPSLGSLSARDDQDHTNGLFNYEAQPVRRNFRMYVGLGLAIILSLLVYKTWRGNSPFSANHAAPAALPQEAPSPAQTASVPAQTPAPESAEPKVPTSTSNQGEPAASAPVEAATKPAARKVRPLTPQAAPSNASAAGSQEQQNGAVELAAGEKYLNGGPGTARDPGQAAYWLWKAVAKKNLTATMMLSDLYLHGEGVSKSCDQARLLLDAAARKGNAAAAERLRNMPAFGCQ